MGLGAGDVDCAHNILRHVGCGEVSYGFIMKFGQVRTVYGPGGNEVMGRDGGDWPVRSNEKAGVVWI